MLVKALVPMKLWPNSCQGTGTNFVPAEALYDVELDGLAVVVVGVVEVLDVAEVSLVPDNDKTAKSIRPDCGSTTISRTCPTVVPSDDFTVLPITWLARIA